MLKTSLNTIFNLFYSLSVSRPKVCYAPVFMNQYFKSILERSLHAILWPIRLTWEKWFRFYKPGFCRFTQNMKYLIARQQLRSVVYSCYFRMIAWPMCSSPRRILFRQRQLEIWRDGPLLGGHETDLGMWFRLLESV